MLKLFSFYVFLQQCCPWKLAACALILSRMQIQNLHFKGHSLVGAQQVYGARSPLKFYVKLARESGG